MLTDNLVVMISSIVASVLLMHRKGINQDALIQKTVWVYEQIKARNHELSLQAAPSSAIISSCLKYLEGFVDRKRDVFEPSVSAKKDYKNIIMLSYYRNNLIHVFINDAEVACSILGMSSI